MEEKSLGVSRVFGTLDQDDGTKLEKLSFSYLAMYREIYPKWIVISPLSFVTEKQMSLF